MIQAPKHLIKQLKIQMKTEIIRTKSWKVNTRGQYSPRLRPLRHVQKNTDLDDRGPGPPIEKHAGGNHGNQAEVKEPLQEEVACSASKSGDKNTADITQQNEVQGATGSSATQTEWSSSTEVCPWEDEENRTDSHQPFIKTYATLGFL